MKSWKRGALWMVLFAGLLMMAWPPAQFAYGRWRQARLQAAFQVALQSQSVAPNQENVAPSPREITSAPARVLAPRETSATGAPPLSTSPAPPAAAKKPAPQASPTAAPETRWLPTRLRIAALDLDAIVVQGIDDAALREGPGHDSFSVLPGQNGNCVIAAHRNAYGWWFYKLNTLAIGKLIALQTPRATYVYRVAKRTVVGEREAATLKLLEGDGKIARLTLYSCTLPKSDRRVLVTADLVETRPAAK